MNTINKALLTIVLTFFVLSVYGFTGNKDSVRYELLLSGNLLKEMQINNNLINSVDITSKRLILLSSPDQFYLLGWGGIVPLGNKVAPNIGSFAFTPDSLLMAIRNNELCYLDSLGKLSALYKLPDKGMGISAGRYVMYIYDRNSTKNKHALYVLAGGGKYTKLLEVPKPINSVLEWNNSILLCTGNAILQYNLKSKGLQAIAALPDDKIIKSLAVDSVNGRIYFSTDSMICAEKGSEIVVITDKLGGTLRYFNGLIVLNPARKLLIRIVGMEHAIASKSISVKNGQKLSQPIEILTNPTIIELVKDELSDELIISIIKHSKVDFNLSVESMITLSNQHVSSTVILAMKQAMKQTLDTK
jgi:hypothetical protein